MSRVEQKAETREGILTSAARLVRRKGIGGASVEAVMRGAGLTVGGFYAHFRSKEALVDAALERTMAQSRERLFKGLEADPPKTRLERIVRRYLSPAQRDAGDEGCPLPAVVGEVATTAPEHAEVLEAELGRFAEALAQNLPAESSRRTHALGLIALLYGGLSLARAVKGTALSDELLKACRAFALGGTP
jgi:TetR/AcrR family transcriptional repressor of nem operon